MCHYFDLALLVDSVLCLFFLVNQCFYALTVFGTDHTVRCRKQERKDKSTKSIQHLRSTDHAVLQSMQGCPSVLVLPFILHLAFTTFTALFVMHVQVSTRFLSASPPIYWFASYILVSPSSTSRRWGYLIWVYFITFILLGSLLFSNFYPFT